MGCAWNKVIEFVSKTEEGGKGEKLFFYGSELFSNVEMGDYVVRF